MQSYRDCLSSFFLKTLGLNTNQPSFTSLTGELSSQTSTFLKIESVPRRPPAPAFPCLPYGFSLLPYVIGSPSPLCILKRSSAHGNSGDRYVRDHRRLFRVCTFEVTFLFLFSAWISFQA